MPAVDPNALLSLVGGASNVAELTHCWARLRFTLHDDAAADQDALEALPGVVMVLRRGGQLQVASRSNVLELHAAVAALLPPSAD